MERKNVDGRFFAEILGNFIAPYFANTNENVEFWLLPQMHIYQKHVYGERTGQPDTFLCSNEL